MNNHQRAEAVVQGWVARLVASPLYKQIYGDCDCSEWADCPHKTPPTELDKGAAQENADSIMLSELGQALNGDYGLARQTLSIIKDRFLKLCVKHDPGTIDVVAKLHEIEIEEITNAFKLLED
jgi:hypothetical protein